MQNNSNTYHPKQGKSPNFLGTISIFVPDDCIGAIIGSKGSNVKELQTSTNTNIKVQPDYYAHQSPKMACVAIKLPGENDGSADSPAARNLDEYGSMVASSAINNALSDMNSRVGKQGYHARTILPSNLKHEYSRKICIDGPDDVSVLKGVFMIFKRVAEVHHHTLINQVKLHIEFKIPDRVVGSLIGKRGIYIQELKRVSNGCDILVSSKKDGSDAIVCLFGCFGPCLAVSCRICYLIEQFTK